MKDLFKHSSEEKIIADLLSPYTSFFDLLDFINPELIKEKFLNLDNNDFINLNKALMSDDKVFTTISGHKIPYTNEATIFEYYNLHEYGHSFVSMIESLNFLHEASAKFIQLEPEIFKELNSARTMIEDYYLNNSADIISFYQERDYIFSSESKLKNNFIKNALHMIDGLLDKWSTFTVGEKYSLKKNQYKLNEYSSYIIN